MNKEQKQELKRFYQAPKPAEKAEFLKKFDETDISTMDFLRMQIRYIHKWNWILGGVIFLLAVLGGRLLNGAWLWCISAVMPFLALTAVSEISQSACFGMEELELSARFSLKYVTMARMGILGIGSFLMLLAVLPVLGMVQKISLFYCGVNVIMPYLLTAFLNLVIVRFIHGRESIYACIGVTIFVSAGYSVLGYYTRVLYELLNAQGWTALGAVLLFLTGRELKEIVKQTEEYVWN